MFLYSRQKVWETFNYKIILNFYPYFLYAQLKSLYSTASRTIFAATGYATPFMMHITLFRLLASILKILH
jgi:hypothetical protein